MFSKLLKTAAYVMLVSAVLLCGCSSDGPAPDPEAHDLLRPQKIVIAYASAEADAGDYFPELSISREFGVTRPASELVTAYESYFITGVSDPEIPVFFEGEELERQGESGLFGVLAELLEGENTYEFSQNDVTETVTIIRHEHETETLHFSEIRQDSMVPEYFAGAGTGGELELGCIAPAGAAVTAEFAGESVELKQDEENAESGVPAFFTGSIRIPEESFDPALTENAGKVTYILDYEGESKNYESSGDVYVFGGESRYAVQMERYMAFCYPDNTFGELTFRDEKLKRGAVDYVVSEGNGYVELASGGFVSKESVRPLTGEVDLSNRLLDVQGNYDEKSERYVFYGTEKPAYHTELSDESFSFTLFNTYGEATPLVAESRLISGVEAISAGNLINFEFTLKSAIWGYSVDYAGKATVLTFFYRPETGSLEGVRVVLDPGHGGSEPGASGVAGSKGPLEKDINLAHSFALRDELAARGAEVILTRSGDEYMSLDERLMFPALADADIFISIHHNSIREDMDANEIDGVEAYYHTPMSLPLAESLFTGLTVPLGRDERFVEESYYRVTLNPRCPAVLLELGYMSNPLEYENASDIGQIERFAKAAAESIESLFTGGEQETVSE